MELSANGLKRRGAIWQKNKGFASENAKDGLAMRSVLSRQESDEFSSACADQPPLEQNEQAP
jgi:hypothetical protein